MRRKIVVTLLAVIMSGTSMMAQSVMAAEGGCKAFGQDTAGLAQQLGRDFGAATSSNPDVSGFVRGLHATLCSDSAG